MIATIRRWWAFMGLSALLNLGVWTLVGHFWRPLPAVAPLPAPRMMLLTLLPPAQMVQPPPPRPKPRPRAAPPKPKPPPRLIATPLPPAPHRPSRVSPAPAPSGGKTPAPRPKTQDKPASQFHLLAPAAPQAPVPQAPQNIDREPPDAASASDGRTPPAPDPGPATTPDPGKANTETPGTKEADIPGKGIGDGTGTGSGSGSGAGQGSGVGLFGTTGSGGGGTAPRHIVYVLDISGSMDMREQKFHGKRRIEQARDELNRQFQTLSDGETFSVIAFSDDVRLFRPELVKADKGTLRDAQRFLRHLEPRGGTDLEHALNAALAVPGVNVIAVITDGVPNTPGHDYHTPGDFDALAARIHAADAAGVPIYTYGLLGPNPDNTDDTPLAAAFLTRLAADSKGKFAEVKLDGEGP